MTLEYVLNEVFVNLNCQVLNATLNLYWLLGFSFASWSHDLKYIVACGATSKKLLPPKQNAEKGRRNAVEITR